MGGRHFRQCVIGDMTLELFVRLPPCGLFCPRNVSIRAACFSRRLLCSCTWSGAERRVAVTDASPACSAVVCCSSHCLTCASNFSFFCGQSPNVPLHAFAAFDDSLTPSKAKWVPPKKSCSAQTNRISLKSEVISSCMDETKAAIVL
jgi:hypothetical protein